MASGPLSAPNMNHATAGRSRRNASHPLSGALSDSTTAAATVSPSGTASTQGRREYVDALDVVTRVEMRLRAADRDPHG